MLRREIAVLPMGLCLVPLMMSGPAPGSRSKW